MYWPLEQTLWTDVNYILVAFEGHQEQLKAIFGGGEDAPSQKPFKVSKDAKGRDIQLTAEIFDIQFETDRRRNLRAKVQNPPIPPPIPPKGHT